MNGESLYFGEGAFREADVDYVHATTYFRLEKHSAKYSATLPSATTVWSCSPRPIHFDLTPWVISAHLSMEEYVRILLVPQNPSISLETVIGRDGLYAFWKGDDSRKAYHGTKLHVYKTPHPVSFGTAYNGSVIYISRDPYWSAYSREGISACIRVNPVMMGGSRARRVI